MISFVNAMKLIPARGLDVKCRISRAEFWWDYLALFIAMIIISVLTVLLRISGFRFLAVFGILFLAVLVVWVILAIRRIHDLDMSGWWVLVMLVPYLGGAAVLGMCLVKGNVGPNRFGPDPYSPGIIEALLAKKNAFKAQQPNQPQPAQGQQPGFPAPQQGFQQPQQGFAQQPGFQQQGFAQQPQGFQQPQPGFAQQPQAQGAQPQQPSAPEAPAQSQPAAETQAPESNASNGAKPQ